LGYFFFVFREKFFPAGRRQGFLAKKSTETAGFFASWQKNALNPPGIRLPDEKKQKNRREFGFLAKKRGIPGQERASRRKNAKSCRRKVLPGEKKQFPAPGKGFLAGKSSPAIYLFAFFPVSIKAESRIFAALSKDV